MRHCMFNDNGTIRVWNTPFSEDGWYDVKYTSDSVADTNDWVFSNYNGDDSNRLSLDSGNGTVAINNVGGYTYEYVYEYALEHPTDVVGAVIVPLGTGELFQAVYGMVKAE